MFGLFKTKNKKFDSICDEKIKDLFKSGEVSDYLIFQDEEQIINWTNANYNYFNEVPYTDTPHYIMNPRKAIYNYTGNVHININMHLRGIYSDESENTHNIIDNIDNAMEESSIVENVLAFRIDDFDGITKKMKRGDTLQKECILTEKAFLSTTLLPGNKIKWLGDKKEEERVLMIIKVPQRAKCISTCNTSSSKDEYELLINRNCELEVEKLIYQKEKNIIMLCKVKLEL